MSSAQNEESSNLNKNYEYRAQFLTKQNLTLTYR